MSHRDLSRRTFLGAAAAGAASSLISLPGVAAIASTGVRKKAKNIIFCVSDGMSAGVPTMVDHYTQALHGRPSYWRTLMQEKDVVNSHMDTRSLNSMVTDSSAASSSWGSGVHILNGFTNFLPGIGDLTPLYDILGKDGMKRGLVTTATITHATPSGFAVAVRSRSAEPEIARQYRERGVEVLMGGGHEHFASDLRSDKLDLYKLYSDDAYKVCKTKADLASAPNDGKLLGVFSKGQIPYTIDRINNPAIDEVVPSLAVMSKKAIDILRKGRSGFVLQIEGARIDHAAHSNDLGALINDQIEFEEAVKVAMEFAREDGETLVIVTSDHGNANPGITGKADFGPENGLLKVAKMKSSYEAMSSELKGATTPEAMTALLEQKLAITLTPAQAQAVVDGYAGKSCLKPFGNYGSNTSLLAMALGSHTGIGWTSGSHTSDHVILTAYGPGKELFSGVVQNVDCFDKMLSLRELKFKNPKTTLDDALEADKKERSAQMAQEHQDEHATESAF